MAIPSGKIVARPMVVRSCGHEQEFQHHEVDRFRAQRLEKFQQTRCSECTAKINEEQQRAAETKLKKGAALDRLPPGTTVTLTRQQDRRWAGSLTVEGKSVEVTGISGAGPESVIVALARLWVAESESTSE